MNHLTKHFAWAISQVSKDDGRTGYVSYWTDRGKAEDASENVQDGHVVQVELWEDEEGNYYQIPYTNDIMVDLPDKKEILNKLTLKERKVLGL